MRKSKKSHQNNLDHEEKELLSSFENDEWKTGRNLKKEKAHMASNTLRKDVHINIRLSSSDISNIKQRAAYEGLPYQTLIASNLHKEPFPMCLFEDLRGSFGGFPATAFSAICQHILSSKAMGEIHPKSPQISSENSHREWLINMQRGHLRFE